MKVFLITQDEPFFLGEAIEYLLDHLPAGVVVANAYVLEGSPFGKRKNFIEKTITTAKVFGIRFFLIYAGLFVRSRFSARQVPRVLRRRGVPFDELRGDINGPDSLAHIRRCMPDVILSLASNQIFKRDLLALPPKGCLNLHTAKLPEYRGLMPLFWAMSNDEDEIGVTVFLMNEGVDSGPIVRQEAFPVANFSMHQLVRITKIMGMRLVNKSLADLRDGTVQFSANADNEATRFGFPSRASVRRFRARGKSFF